MSATKNLLTSGKAGAGLGLGVGLIDVYYRLSQQRFEGFEFYQAVMLPAAFLMLLFLAAHILLYPFSRVIGKSAAASPHKLLSPLALAALIFYSVAALTFLLFGGDFSLAAEKQPAPIILGLTFGACFALTVMKLGRSRLDGEQVGVLKEIGENVGFLFLVMILLLMGYDAFTYESFPQAKPKPANVILPKNLNLVLVTLDTVRADAINEEASPFLHSIRESSLNFPNARSVSSWTLPSHASIFTGQYPFQHKATRKRQLLNLSRVTLAEVFRANGYQTAGFVGGPYTKSRYGLAQGFDVYRDRLDFFEFRHTENTLSFQNLLSLTFPRIQSELLGVDGERTAGELNYDLKRWLLQAEDRPAFIFLNYFDAHDPYFYGEKYRELFASKEALSKYSVKELNQLALHSYTDFSKRYEEQEPPAVQIEALKALYLAEVRHLDDQIRALFGVLKLAGRLENTLFVFTSDHGEEFFEHGGAQHGVTLYDEVIRVPLFIYGAGFIQPTVSEIPVSLVDIFPTITEIFELAVPPRTKLSGQSLLYLDEQEEESERFVLAQRYPIPSIARDQNLTSIASNKRKIIEVSRGKGRIDSSLFDLSKDPREDNNLIYETAKEAELFELRGYMTDFLMERPLEKRELYPEVEEDD